MTETRKYRYEVSLRISHPSLPPEEITAALGLEPSRSWAVGQSRQTPTGRSLPGKYKNCFWSHSFDTPADGKLEAFLMTLFNSFSAQADTFRKVADTGGHAELSIGMYMQYYNVELYFESALFTMFSDLGVSLFLDLYDPDKPESNSA